jgi:hypothetical protein
MTIDGPVSTPRGIFVAGTAFDLAEQGYSESEYFVSGTAEAYERSDIGVVATESAEYRTRLIVYRPSDATRFDGTVIVEWLNVSGGLDTAADWGFLHRELMRRGSVWVGVSAQIVGVHGGESVMAMPGAALTKIDPERYGSLRHPGDRFSYSMYSQVGAALRNDSNSPLADLTIERLIAIGESQSAFRLTTYINEIDPLDHVYDGFLVHARGRTSAPLDDDGPAITFEGDPVFFRDDLRVPVLCVEAETDLITLGYHAARQDDTERFRLWEMAGTSHADVYTFVVGPIDSGTLPISELAAAWRATGRPYGFELEQLVNAGPQRYVVAAALTQLDRWLRDGTPPPPAPRLEVHEGDPLSFRTDALGNAQGGIRTPHVDVPVAVLSGIGNAGAPIARLCGTTIPFGADQLSRLYPSKDEYLARFEAATAAAVAAGFVLASDADEINAIAATNYPQ